MERLGGSVVCACVGGLCSPGTEVRLGARPGVLPWARAPLFCNIPGCMFVCLVCFSCFKGKHQSECPPTPPCAWRLLADCIYLATQRGHCQPSYLAGFRAERFRPSPASPYKTIPHLERRPPEELL